MSTFKRLDTGNQSETFFFLFFFSFLFFFWRFFKRLSFYDRMV